MTSQKRNSKRLLELGSSTSMRPTPLLGQGYCETEKDYWRVFLRECDLGPQEIKLLHGLDYTSMTRVSILGMHRNIDSLVEAGITEVKAHLILLFATYLLHCKYHKFNVSKDLSMNQVLEFNFLLSHPEQLEAAHDDDDVREEEELETKLGQSAGESTVHVAVTDQEEPAEFDAGQTTNDCSANDQVVEGSRVQVEVQAQRCEFDSTVAESVGHSSCGASGLETSSNHTKNSKSSKGSNSKTSSKTSSSKSSKKKKTRKSRAGTGTTSTHAADTAGNTTCTSSRRRRQMTNRRHGRASRRHSSASMDMSDSSMGSTRSFASKSSFRSCRSGASKKSVSWNPTFKFNKSFNGGDIGGGGGVACPAIDELSTRTPTTVASSRWSASSYVVPEHEAVTNPEVAPLPSIRRTSTTSSSDEKARRPRRRPSVEIESKEDLLKLFEKPGCLSGCGGGSGSVKTLPLFPPVHAEANIKSLKGEKSTPQVPAAKRDEATATCTTSSRVASASLPVGGAISSSCVGNGTGRSPCNMTLAFAKETSPPPPMCPYERATLRWAQALDVDEDLTDSDWSDTSSESDDDDDWDSDDSDSESESEESHSDEKLKVKGAGSKTTVLSWKTQNVTIEEWTHPANKVLPVNLQSMFRAAASNPDLNIEEQIHRALKSSMTPTAA